MTRHAGIFVMLMLAVASMLTGCVKNEFEVEFMLSGDVNSTYTLVYYASDSKKGWVVEQVVPVQKGVARMTGVTRNPALVYVMATGNRNLRVAFYAERGDRIKIEGKGSDPASWTITGNHITEELSAWRAAHIKDVNVPNALNRGVTDYVTAHPDDPVSALLLLTVYDRRADEDGFVKAWSLLKGDAAEPEWRELVSRADMTGAEVGYEIPKRIVLNTIETGCDTITPGRVPVLMYFTRNNVDSHKEDIKKIRRLSEETGDSSGRVIAEISFEPDSAARWYGSMRDSLRNVVRGWMPLGVSDAQARKLGVSRVPYVIVLDRRGKAVYRGDDLEAAAARMRALVKQQ